MLLLKISISKATYIRGTNGQTLANKVNESYLEGCNHFYMLFNFNEAAT